MSVSLLDIAPQSDTVEVNGEKLAVHGVSARGVAALMGRFPQMRALLSGKDFKMGTGDITKLLPDAIAAIIAAGCGMPGDEKAEAAADKLPVEAQLDAINKIIKLTMPGGVGPLVEKLTALGAIVNDASADGGKAPVMKSRKP